MEKDETRASGVNVYFDKNPGINQHKRMSSRGRRAVSSRRQQGRKGEDGCRRKTENKQGNDR